ncbi:hypothetical protein PHYPSEUDO_012941 [Phytophthora pseudosyringae]|uniref:Uncharacterized protein n=1 Tax=Phytophthora pseudosyringae TaxID=221518 RepID=A0A8T1VAT9_9STRA|nr:hypothetical protein PHYPSEUDO_012941 [Phytophthora pseudosyringae]
MRLQAPDGTVVNPNTQYRTLCQLGTQVKDIMHWSWTKRGNLQVTALTPTVTTGIRRQIRHLMWLMVLNFPHLLRNAGHGGGVRYVAKPADHEPIRRFLT